MKTNLGGKLLWQVFKYSIKIQYYKYILFQMNTQINGSQKMDQEYMNSQEKIFVGYNKSTSKCQVQMVFRVIFLDPSGNKIYFPKFIKAQVVTSPPMSNWLCSYKMADQGTEILITRLRSKTWNS